MTTDQAILEELRDIRSLLEKSSPKNNREEFLNLHIDDLKRTIWLMEISRDILVEPIKRSNDRKTIDELIKLQNQTIAQITGNNQRIQFIRKVISGTAQVDNPAPPDQPTHPISP